MATLSVSLSLINKPLLYSKKKSIKFVSSSKNKINFFTDTGFSKGTFISDFTEDGYVLMLVYKV